MKKIVLASVLFTLLLALAACGGASSSTVPTGDSTSLTLEEELLVGTFRLESTGLAVSSDQASQLLPLWQILQSLATSGTAASEEIEAVVNQIKSTMSAQQIDAITAMKLTQQDLISVMADMGASSGNSDAGSTSNTSSVQGLTNAGSAVGAGDPGAGLPAGGGEPGAGVPGGGDLAGAGGGRQPDLGQVTTSQASDSQSNGTSNQISSTLISALVELLQKKVG